MTTDNIEMTNHRTRSARLINKLLQNACAIYLMEEFTQGLNDYEREIMFFRFAEIFNWSEDEAAALWDCIIKEEY